MSKNAIVTVTAINQALSLEVRPFNSALLITKTLDIKSDLNLPITITSASQLLERYPSDLTVDSPEYVMAKDFFLAEPKPTRLFVYGELSGNYTDILMGLNTRWAKQWFVTMPVDSTVASMKEVFDFIDGSSNEYVVVFQSAANVTIADNIANVKQYPRPKGYYVAADVEEKQAANLVGTKIELFPGSSPWSTTQLTGMTGSTYDETEKLELVGVNENSATGINICTIEDTLPVIYYGKSMDGTTWFDYVLAKIAVDEYMRVGIFKYMITKNTTSKIPANAIGRSQIAAEGMRILQEFVDREIIYGQGDFDDEGNPLLDVNVISLTNRTVELEYICTYQGAIIKARININLSSIDGN